MSKMTNKLATSIGHGMYVGATGDMTRLRRLKKSGLANSSTVRGAWMSTGKSLRTAMQQVDEGSRTSRR